MVCEYCANRDGDVSEFAWKDEFYQKPFWKSHDQIANRVRFTSGRKKNKCQSDAFWHLWQKRAKMTALSLIAFPYCFVFNISIIDGSFFLISPSDVENSRLSGISIDILSSTLKAILLVW